MKSETTEQPDFGEKMRSFWQLAQAAALHLESLYLRSKEVATTPFGTHIPHVSLSDATNETVVELQDHIEVYRETHGRLDNAAIAAYIAELLRHYEGQAIGIDAGDTNLALRDALAHSINKGREIVALIVTNNLGLAYLPDMVANDKDAPLIKIMGGLVRKKGHSPRTLGNEDVTKRIRRHTLAASVISTTGFNSPWLLTATGQDTDTKRAFIKASRDIIMPVPTFKWGSMSGEKFMKLQNIVRNRKKMVSIVTVFPHEDLQEARVLRDRALKFQESFIDTAGELISASKFETDIKVAKVQFSPNTGLNPLVTKHLFDEIKLCYAPVTLRDLYNELNPKRRTDIRMVICFELHSKKKKEKKGNNTELRHTPKDNASAGNTAQRSPTPAE